MNPITLRRCIIAAGIVCALLLVAALVIPLLGRTCILSSKSQDRSNLRLIGMASLVYAADHNDRHPTATDVWDYARQLAEGGGLNEAGMWTSKVDPAYRGADASRIAILVTTETTRRQLNPAFPTLKPSVAVILGEFASTVPATTPIIWTRGLQPDGTWASHSPYGKDEGGYIVFADSRIAFFKNIRDDGGKLVRFGTTTKTANILEALPPGTRIGEYVPTAEEQIAWSKR